MKFRLFSRILQRQRFLAARPNIRGDVLDLGCNTGDILAWLKPGQYYVGVDAAENIAAWWKVKRPEIEFHLRDLDHDDLKLGRRFDTVLMLAILEHLGRPDSILQQISEVLTPTGRLVITTPSVIGDRIHHLGAKVGVFSQHAAEEHKAQFTEPSLRKLMSNHGLSVTRYRPFLFGGNQLFVCELRR